MRHYYPKSQVGQLSAVLLWGLGLLALRQQLGLDWTSGGAPLAGLLGLGLVGYLTSGQRLDVDRAGGQVRTVWRLVGVPLWERRQAVVAQQVELRPAWMRHSGPHKTLVYDLVLVGRAGAGGAATDTVEFDLKEDQVMFTLAERRARAVGAALDLPVAVRWERVFTDTPGAVRGQGEWHQPFPYPQTGQDWRKWG